jgi:hypothetical protein
MQIKVMALWAGMKIGVGYNFFQLSTEIGLLDLIGIIRIKFSTYILLCRRVYIS